MPMPQRSEVFELDLPHNLAVTLLAIADHDGEPFRLDYGLVSWRTGFPVYFLRKHFLKLNRRGILRPAGCTNDGKQLVRVCLDDAPRKAAYSPKPQTDQQKPSYWKHTNRVFNTDHRECVYCGSKESKANALTLDHVIPQSKGGTHDFDNLVTACRSCNSRKGARIGIMVASFGRFRESAA